MAQLVKSLLVTSSISYHCAGSNLSCSTFDQGSCKFPWKFSEHGPKTWASATCRDQNKFLTPCTHLAQSWALRDWTRGWKVTTTNLSQLLQKRVVSPWSIENDPETHTNHQSWKLYLKFEWQKHKGRTALKCIKECNLKALSWGTNFLISFGVLLFLVIPPSEEDLSQPHNRDLLHLILCNHANGILRAEATWWLHWIYTSSSWFLIYEDVVLGMVSNWLISNYHSDLSQQFLVQMS